MSAKIVFNEDMIAIIRMLVEVAIKYGQPMLDRLLEIWKEEDVVVTPEIIKEHLDRLPSPEDAFERILGTPGDDE